MVVMAAPAVLLIMIGLNAYRALILSQVVLSLQLPLTIIPAAHPDAPRQRDGRDALRQPDHGVGLALAAIIIGLNVFLLYQTFFPKASEMTKGL